MFRLEIMFFFCRLLIFLMQIGKRIRLEQHYQLLYMGLQIKWWVHLQLHQGKTINNENNTRRFSSTTSSSDDEQLYGRPCSLKWRRVYVTSSGYIMLCGQRHRRQLWRYGSLGSGFWVQALFLDCPLLITDCLEAVSGLRITAVSHCSCSKYHRSGFRCSNSIVWVAEYML